MNQPQECPEPRPETRDCSSLEPSAQSQADTAELQRSILSGETPTAGETDDSTQPAFPEYTEPSTGSRPSPEQITPLDWTAIDGTRYHTIITRMVREKLDDPDHNVSADTEVPVQVSCSEANPTGEGRIDILLNHRHLLDIKTDDMREWSSSTALRRAEDYANCMNDYLASPQISIGAKGYLLMVGRPPIENSIWISFIERARSLGVEVILSPSADPIAVTALLKERFLSAS